VKIFLWIDCEMSERPTVYVLNVELNLIGLGDIAKNAILQGILISTNVA